MEKPEGTFTHNSNKGGFWSTVIDNKSKLPLDVSDNLIGGIRTSVPQSPVSFYNNAWLICCFVQPILLLKCSNILNVAIKQAENVIHNSKQPENTSEEYEIWISLPIC